MKKLLILLNVLIGILIIGACDESQVGYLLTKDAAYEPDTIIIRQTLDPELDAVRIETGAPWVSLKMQGYAGSDPISFSVDGVTSSEGEEAARLFHEEVYARGGGVLLYPQKPKYKVPVGRYTVSVRVTNEGWSQVVEDALTFIVKE